MRAENRVLVERVVIIVTGPGANQLDRLEGGYPVRERRPDDLLERRIVDLEIKAIGVRRFRRRDAADEAGALGPEIDAAWIDQQRRVGNLGPAIEHIDETLARPHRQFEAGQAGDARRPKTRGVDGRAAADRAGRAETHPRDPPAAAVKTDDLVLQIVDSERSGFAAKGLEQRVGVEPALVGEAERSDRKSTSLNS